jgi:uncharacterized protein (TIGR02996 family)
MDDTAFLRAILDNPADDAPRLVYADWLEEQNDPAAAAKAEFLRATAELATRAGNKGWKRARGRRLHALAAGLDPDWLVVVSRLRVENCDRKRAEFTGQRRPLQFEFVCDRRWEDMRPTADDAVRHCDACRQAVHYCHSITEARQHALGGHCIAVDLGVIRCEGDLGPPMMLGRASPDLW